MRLDLIRHGDTGRAGYLDGRTDSALTTDGWRQIEMQTSAKHWPLVVASPLSRTRLPAVALAKKMGARLIVDPDWAELDFGLWEGRARAEIAADASERDLLAAFYNNPLAHRPPNGECWTSLEARIVRAMERVMGEAGGNPVLVLTHAGPMRAAVSLSANVPLQSLWSLRIGYGARLTLEVDFDSGGKLWGELVELTQP
jgi:alpha-ribazole phosphatase